MNKKPIVLINTDFHLNPNNQESIYNLHVQAINVANTNGIKNHIWLGDIFDSRVSQKQSVLNTLTKIIELYDEAGHKIYCLVGNHDKTDYNSSESFLDSYKYHPSFDLISETDYRQIVGLNCYFIPFYNDDIWKEELLSLNPQTESYLFSHIAITGSINNDKTTIENSIKSSDFKCFKKVLLGHYHDYQQISSNIFHLGSIQQNNFGEDEEKGFWLLNEDGVVTLVKSEIGKKFNKLIVDLDQTTVKEAEKMIEIFKKENPTTNIRVELWGEKSTVHAFDKSKLEESGISVKKKYREIESIESETSEVKALTNSDLMNKLKIFCEENSYDYEEGLTILKLALCR